MSARNWAAARNIWISLGLNYYNNNQWIHNGRTIWPGDRLYRPLHEILREYKERYGCPMFLAETGCEGDDRPLWFRYVAGEVQISMAQGVPLEGICLYPVADHQGWDNDRHCPNGLFGYPDEHGDRPIHEPLARELKRQQAISSSFCRVRSNVSHRKDTRRKCFIKEMGAYEKRSDLFLALRWGFVYQRPQHLLSRFARASRVFYVEEPTFEDDCEPHQDLFFDGDSGVRLVVPRLPRGLSEAQVEQWQRHFVDEMIRDCEIRRFYYVVLYADGPGIYYPPAAGRRGVRLHGRALGFSRAPPKLRAREADLFRRSSLVFTGGQSLYEAKKHQHKDVHAFPSSVDVAHFGQGRNPLPEPADQAGIPHPRAGYCGVVDERMDRELLGAVARLRPDVHFVMLGPVVKIDAASLPHAPNIHYLGSKNYKELPAYLSGWDAALLPFAHNEATRYVSPTKTPEYLAAGKPVVSTSIRDVVRPYGSSAWCELPIHPSSLPRRLTTHWPRMPRTLSGAPPWTHSSAARPGTAPGIACGI